MRLIHCADLHLDSALETNLSPEQARQRSGELRMAFSRLVRYAREHQVSAVLISGDLFDARRITAFTAQLVLEEIRRAPEIAFFYLRGNHDEDADVLSVLSASAGQKPENLLLFSDTWSSRALGSVVITGAELNGDNDTALYQTLRLNREKTNIVMLHGQVTTQPGRDCVALPLLREHGIDYLALGHIHTYRQGRLDSRGIWCYSGCLEGRGFDECGEKGFVLLETMPSGGISSTFIPFAQRTVYHLSADLTGVSSFPELRQRAEQAVQAIPHESMLRLTLCGKVPPELPKNPELLEQLLQQQFWYAQVVDETELQLEPEDYLQDISLRGVFVRMVMEGEEPGKEREQILRYGLAALSGEESEL